MFETAVERPRQPESNLEQKTTSLQTGEAIIQRQGKTVARYNAESFVITSIKLRGKKGSVELFDILEPPQPEVLLRRVREARCSTDKKTYIHSNWVETELDLVALLHEMGHVRQATDPKTRNISDFEKITKRTDSGEPWEKLEPMIQKILEFYPHRANQLKMDEQTRSALEELKREEWPRFRQNQINERLQTEKDSDIVDKLQDEYMALLEQPVNQSRVLELRTQLAPFFRSVKAVLQIPENEMERDATRRAFRWMRQINERTGVDLFVMLNIKNKQRITPNKNTDSEDEVTVTAIEELASALCTYTDRGNP